MSEGIIIAIIGAAGLIVAALIKAIGTNVGKKKGSDASKAEIIQEANGDNTTMIGIQNNYKKDKDL